MNRHNRALKTAALHAVRSGLRTQAFISTDDEDTLETLVRNPTRRAIASRMFGNAEMLGIVLQ